MTISEEHEPKRHISQFQDNNTAGEIQSIKQQYQTMNLTLQTILGIMAASADESAKVEMAQRLIQEGVYNSPTTAARKR